MRQRAHRVQQVLAVVEHQQQRARRERRDQRVEGRRLGRDRHVEDLRHGVGHERGIGQAGQLDHPSPVRPAIGARMRRGLREAALADAAGAQHGDERVRFDELAQRRQVGLATEQRLEPDGQVRAARRRRDRRRRGACVQ
jgi:hypothetical protein